MIEELQHPSIKVKIKVAFVETVTYYNTESTAFPIHCTYSHYLTTCSSKATLKNRIPTAA